MSTRLNCLKAMVWKEWRENLKWALLMGAAFSLLLSYTVWRAVTDDSNIELLDLWQRTQPLTFLVVPLLAGVLGFLQVNSELRRDQWAFLVHRPTSRDTLFWGKALTGLSLYALAAVLPYLGFAWWMSVPGHVAAPFDWRLAAAGMAPLLSGIVFYFAGISTAIRAKPWFGSRALALPGSLLCVVWVSLGNWWPLLWLLVFIVFFVVAARSSFETTGCFRGLSRLSQVALSSTLLAGLAVVVALGSVLVAIVLQSGSQDAKPQVMRNYQVTQKGRVLRSEDTHGPSDAVKNSISDLNGNVLLSNSDTRTFYKSNPTLRFSNLAVQEMELPAPLSNAFEHYFSSRTYPDYRQADVSWYFDRIHNRLMGYSRRTRYPIGYIGSNGFHTDAQQVKPFDETLRPSQTYEESQMLRFPHSVYKFDAASRNVRRVFTSSQRITGASLLSAYDPNFQPRKRCIAIWTNDNVLHLLPLQGKELWTRHLEINHENYTQLSIAQTSAADRFWIWIKPYNEKRVAQPPTLIAVNARGETLNQQTLPLFPANEGAGRWQDSILFVAVPPILVAIYTAFGLRSDQSLVQILAGMTSGSSSEVLRATLIILILNFIVSALCAFFAWRRANRYAFKSSTRLWWTIGVLALGPLGYLLMRSLLDWPALEKCPSCGKLRVVDRELCEHCSSPFAPPLLDGTEIIEDDASEVPALRLAS